ncbi:MAG: MFS transporter [Chlamydiota bacterium]
MVKLKAQKILWGEGLAATLAIGIEYYSVFIYGYLAPIIAPYFFAGGSHLHMWGSIALGYLLAPLGAVICGHFGDTKGRKIISAWTIALVAIPTFVMSILPTYDHIGIWASILFVILHSIQGMAFGGEFLGLFTFIMEKAPRHRRGFLGGIISCGSAIGVLAASLMVSALHLLDHPYSNWLWRIPLALGGVGILLALYFYHLHGDTEVFMEEKAENDMVAWPILELFKNNFGKFIKIIGITTLAPIITIVVFGFLPYVAIKELGFSQEKGMWFNTMSLGMFIFAPLFGWLSDKVGRKPILIGVSGAFLILGLPLFKLMAVKSLVSFITIQFIFAFIASAYYGVALIAALELLPINVRFTGAALGYNITYAFFGGAAGAHIVNLLIAETHYKLAPLFYFIIGAALVMGTVLTIKETADEGLDF